MTIAPVVIPIPSYCSRCRRPHRGLYKLVDEKVYCLSCYNLLKRGLLDEDLLKILWKYADESGKIPPDKQKEAINELTKLLGKFSTVLSRLNELEKCGLLRLPENLRGDIYSQTLSVLETYAINRKVEGENFKLALRELARLWNNSVGWVKYLIRSMEELGLVKCHILKFNRLVGVTLFGKKSESIEILTEVGKPKPTVSSGEKVYVIKSGGKEFQLKKVS